MDRWTSGLLISQTHHSSFARRHQFACEFVRRPLHARSRCPCVGVHASRSTCDRQTEIRRGWKSGTVLTCQTAHAGDLWLQSGRTFGLREDCRPTLIASDPPRGYEWPATRHSAVGRPLLTVSCMHVRSLTSEAVLPRKATMPQLSPLRPAVTPIALQAASTRHPDIYLLALIPLLHRRLHVLHPLLH